MDKIDTKKIKRRIKRKLRFTLGVKTTIAMFLMIAAFSFFSVISTKHIFFQMTTNMEVAQMYAIGKTALGVTGITNSERLCDSVRTIYKAIPDEEKNRQGGRDYLTYFPNMDSVENDIDISYIDFVFGVIDERNRSIKNVGLCLLDEKNKKIVIVRDWAGTHPGQIEKFNYKTAVTLDGSKPKFIDRHSNQDYYGFQTIELRAIVPLDDNYDGELQSCLFVDVHDEDTSEWAFIFAVAYIFLFSITAIVIWFIITSIIRSSIIRPIVTLSNAADDWAAAPDKMEEKYYFRDLRIHSNDEVRDLKDAMETMETEIHQYMVGLEKETKEKLKLSSEIEVTARLQANMLPEKLESPDKSFGLFPFMKPARLVGGDFYDFFMIDDNRIGMVMADVSDKGVPASFFMVVSRTIIKNVTKEDADDLEKALVRANNMLCENNKDLMFVTAFIGIYDLTTKILTYVNAGHEDPIVYIKSKDEYQAIYEEHDILLGVQENAVFHKREVHMEPGDRLFLYTDGVTEAMDANDNLFGMERLIECLNKDTTLIGDEIHNELWNEIAKFQEGKNQADDVTMLIFEV